MESEYLYKEPTKCGNIFFSLHSHKLLYDSLRKHKLVAHAKVSTTLFTSLKLSLVEAVEFLKRVIYRDIFTKIFNVKMIPETIQLEFSLDTLFHQI